MVFAAIDELSLDQLYLDQGKVEKNRKLLLASDFQGYPPIEVYELFPGRLTILDGNSRCFLLHEAGIKKINVTFAPVEEIETPIMRPLYEACVRWCQKSDLFHIHDLSARIVPTEVFMEKWVRRCQEMMVLLTACQDDPVLDHTFKTALAAGKEPVALSAAGKLLFDEAIYSNNEKEGRDRIADE